MADDGRHPRRRSSTYRVVFWDFADRVLDFAGVRNFADSCTAGTGQLLANNSLLTEKLASVAVAIYVLRAKLCKYSTKIGRQHFTFTWYYHHVSVIK
jgi:hypothetical protein